jgi:hypothetical protein
MVTGWRLLLSCVVLFGAVKQAEPYTVDSVSFFFVFLFLVAVGRESPTVFSVFWPAGVFLDTGGSDVCVSPALWWAGSELFSQALLWLWQRRGWRDRLQGSFKTKLPERRA